MDEWLDYRNYTAKHYGAIAGAVLLLVGLLYFLVIRESPEEKALREQKKDFVIAYSYEEDLLKPVLEEEKTLEELVADIVKEQLGVGVPKSAYNEVGIRDGIGLFAEAAIYEGDKIPNFPAVTQDELQKMEEVDTDTYIQEHFEEIMARKQAAVNSQRLQQENEQEVLLKELKERLKSQQE